MPLNSGNPLNYYNSVSSFDTHPDYRHDFFNEIQRVVRGVSDINSGKADDFLDRAHTQNYWNTEEKLAEMQEKYDALLEQMRVGAASRITPFPRGNR